MAHITCPNKSSQEWKDLVQALGSEVKAMQAYIDAGENIPNPDKSSQAWKNLVIAANNDEVKAMRVYLSNNNEIPDIKVSTDEKGFHTISNIPDIKIKGDLVGTEAVFYNSEDLKRIIKARATNEFAKSDEEIESRYALEQLKSRSAIRATNSIINLNSIIGRNDGRFYSVNEIGGGERLRGEDYLYYAEDGLSAETEGVTYTLTEVTIDPNGNVYNSEDIGGGPSDIIFDIPPFRFDEHGFYVAGEYQTPKEMKMLKEQRIPNEKKETIERLHKKIARFMTFVPSMYMILESPAELTDELKKNKDLIKIILDPSIPASGQWDKENRIIRFNPNKLGTQTTGHEFAHILYDLLGGQQNKIIRDGIDILLKDNKLVDKIKKLYPEIKDYESDDFYTELIAYGVQTDVEQLFDNYDDRNRFVKWLLRFFANVKARLGIAKDRVKRIAEIIVYAEGPISEDFGDAKTSNIHYSRQSIMDERMDRLNKQEDSILEKIRKEVMSAAQKKLALYKYEINKDKPIEAYKEMLHQLDKAEGSRQVIRAIYNVVNYSLKEIQTAQTKFNLYDQEEKKTGKQVFTARRLGDMKQIVEGYEFLDEIADLLRQRESERAVTKALKQGVSVREIKGVPPAILAGLDKAKGIRDGLLTEYKTKGLEILTDLLPSYSHHVYVYYKDRFEGDYLNLSKEDQAKETKEAYIQRRLDEGIDGKSIDELTRQYIKDELRVANHDINQLQRWIETVYDSQDAIASAVVRIFDKQMFAARKDILSMKNDLIDKIRKLEDFHRNRYVLVTDVRKMYDFMIEKDKNGNPTGHITTRIYSSFWDELQKVKDKVWNNPDNANIPPSRMAEKVKEAVNDFYDLNAPILGDSYRRRSKDQLAYAEELFKQGKISEKDLRFYKVQMDINLHYPYKNLKLTNPAYVEPENYHEHVSEAADQYMRNWISEHNLEYRRFREEWINKDYEKIPTDPSDPRREFYDYVVNTLSKVQKSLPKAHWLYTRLPGVRKEVIERVKSGQELKGIAKDVYNQDVKVTGEDEGRTRLELVDAQGNPIQYLPTYYTEKLEDKDQSYDLGSIFYLYFRMATDFKYKMDVLPELQMAKYFIDTRQVTKRDSNGNIIRDALVSKLERLKEKALTKHGDNSLLAAQFDDWFDSVIYGMKEKGEGFIPGTKIDVAKAVDALNRYTALNMLGINFIQGTANVLLGSAMSMIESAGGVFYNKKDFALANAFYTKNLVGILGDVGDRKLTNIVNVLNETFDTLNEYDNGNFRKNTRFKRLMQTDTAYFTSSAGEHFMQSTQMLAMLQHLRAKNSKGEDIGSMLKFLHVKDGNLSVDPEVVNFGEKEQAEFMLKLKRVISATQGEYYRNAHVAIQRLAVGRMGYMFRKFVVPGFKYRWGGLHVNELTDTMDEGYYRTSGRFVGKFFTNLIKSLKAHNLALMSGTYDKLKDREKANLRKMLTEVSFLLASIILSRLFVNMSTGDDDESETWMTNFLAYQFLRFRSEILFFVNPSDAMKILRSPAAALTMGETLVELADALFAPIINGTFEFERYKRGNRKGQLKVMKPAINLVPGIKQVNRIRYIDDMLNWWNQ